MHIKVLQEYKKGESEGHISIWIWRKKKIYSLLQYLLNRTLEKVARLPHNLEGGTA